MTIKVHCHENFEAERFAFSESQKVIFMAIQMCRQLQYINFYHKSINNIYAVKKI